MERPEDEWATKAGYDYWAASYDDKDPSTWLDEPFLLKHLHPFPGCLILDVGCGTGRYLRQLTVSRYRIIGLDLSLKMLARAKEYLGPRRDICLVQASAGALPFKPLTFDRIMSGLVIDHMASAEQWFREISGMLTMDGQAVVAAVHPDMQRITGWDIDIRSGGDEAIHIPVTAAMLEHRPTWSSKIGQPALLLLALTKAGLR
jgi:ubiquinone/menaquinone biosynthesis C-methylase UbiE